MGVLRVPRPRSGSRWHWWIVAGFAVGVAGCGGYRTSGVAFQPLEPLAGEATVYVYLLPGERTQTYTLSVDGEDVARIGPGAYHAFSARPGSVTLATKIHVPSWRPALLTRAFADEQTTTINVEADSTYYLRGSIEERPMVEKYDLVLEPVEAVIGSVEVELCQLAT